MVLIGMILIEKELMSKFDELNNYLLYRRKYYYEINRYRT